MISLSLFGVGCWVLLALGGLGFVSLGLASGGEMDIGRTDYLMAVCVSGGSWIPYQALGRLRD